MAARRADEMPEGLPQMGQAEEWICVFDARSGGHARAVFDTRDRAMQFAEHHARSVTPAGTPLKWEDANAAAVSTTQLGNYLVARETRLAPSRTAVDFRRRPIPPT
jgi:hypothetical protein